MKNLIIKMVVSTMAFFLSSGVVFAQQIERINFAKAGSNALVWEQKVKANSTKEFVFAAKKGQKLKLSFIDDTNQGSMDLGKISVEPNADPLEMTIDVTKDYRLSVSNNGDKPTSFRISISLETPQKTKPRR